MRFVFNVSSARGDEYQVILSSGSDAFFCTSDVKEIVGDNVEIVEIDLERIKGENPASPQMLTLISEGIARYFDMNKKSVLYYYCDDLSDVAKSDRKGEMWPQEYRSQLFSIMFQRYLIRHGVSDLVDVTMVIEQERPLFMHLIARKEHSQYVEALKNYVTENYGK